MANCACASGWSCLMNLDLIHFLAVFELSSTIRVVDFVPAGKILANRELEVHTVYQKCLTSWQRPTPLVILHAYTRCVCSCRFTSSN